MNETIIAKSVVAGGLASGFLALLQDTEVAMLLVSALVASVLSIFYDFAHSEDMSIDIKLFAKILQTITYSIVVIFVVFYALSIHLHKQLEAPTIVWVLISALVATNAVSLVTWLVDLIKNKGVAIVDMLISAVKKKLGG